MQEMPSIRFRASKPIGDDAGSGLETQALVSQRVALELNDRLQGFQQGGLLPASQTCDLIILDRCAPSLFPPYPCNILLDSALPALLAVMTANMLFRSTR